MKQKLTSRKFLAALSGVLIGIGVIISGDTVEGVVTVLTSVIGYLVAEGMIDAKAVKTSAEAVEEIAAEVADNVMPNTTINKNQNGAMSGFGDVHTALYRGVDGFNATVTGAQNAIAQQAYDIINDAEGGKHDELLQG